MSNKGSIRNIYTQFPGGKHKALTLSYDDGKIPDRRLVSIFNEYGLKATFNVNTLMEKDSYSHYYEERISLKDFPDLYKGHEVACHTLTHPTISRCPKEQMVRQILEDRMNLEQIMKYTVRGMAYPNGSVSETVEEAARACGIAYSRTVNSTKDFSIPEDFLRWNPTCHHSDPDLDEITDRFIELNKTQYLYLFYVWGHSYEFERDKNWEIIENFSKKIGNKSDIWYATNIEIVDYLDRASRVQVSVNGDFAFNPSAESVFLEVDKKTIELKGGVFTEL